MNTRSAMLYVVIILSLQTSVWPRQISTHEDGAQGDVNGTVKDPSGAVLPGVLISIRGLDVSTNTDNTGFFSLKGLPAGEVTLTVSLPGFAKKETTVSIRPGIASKVEIVLELEAQAFTVTVEQITPQLMNAAENIGVVTVLPSQVAALPSLGEKDIFRSLQLMPGVSATNEQSSGLYVRGGTPDQNLVLLDGFTVYKVDHFFGIFSAFNASAVENVSVFKGGFDSRYGGRISSVVDLEGKPGSKTGIEGGGGVSFLSYNGYVDGPIGRKATFMVAGRKSFQSPFSTKIRDNYSATVAGGGPPGGAGTSSEPRSSFYDTNARLTYTPSARDTFVFSLYYGKDNYDNSRSLDLPNFGPSENIALSGEITDLSRWGNAGTSLNWRRDWTSGFSSTLTLAVSHYFKNSHRASSINADSSTSGSGREFGNNSYENNRVNDQTLRWANSWVLGRRNYLEFGAEITRNEVDYNFTFDTDTDTTVHSGEGLVEAFYLQDRYQPFSRFEITPGLRITRYTVTDKTYMEPRLSAIVSATNRLKFKAAGGRYYQFVSDLIRENPMEGDQDFWTLGDDKWIPVSAANQYIGGASYESDRFLLDVEAYHKDLSGLTTFGVFREPPTDLDESSDRFDFDDLFFHGSGKAQGAEFLAQKKFGSNTGWITYALGRVMYDFPAISDTPYPASHDSTHEFKIVDSYRWKKFTFSGNWVFATGKPTTEPTGSREVVMGGGQVFERPTYGATNGSRLPDYHRLDLSTTWDFYRGESTRARAGVSIFNVYNRANVWRREYRFFDGEELTTDVNYLGFTVSAFLYCDFGGLSAANKAGPAWSTGESKKDENPPRSAKPVRVYDFYGNVVAMDDRRVTVRTPQGEQDFMLVKSTVKGEPEYENGAYVHVYYRHQTDGNVVTMIMRKVKKPSEVPGFAAVASVSSSPGATK
jgi:ferric enterobactin receptor